jgi:ABC-type phosphate transport system substrate-binding protein
MCGARQVSALVVALVLQGSPAETWAEPRQAPRYKIVAHPEVAVDKLTRRQLIDVFTRRQTRWPSGDAILPVDLRSDSPVRRDFVVDELKTSVQAIKNYWQQQIFSGRNVPPPELDDDAQVLKYVLKNSGAIGYVSISTSTEGAKIISVE